MDVEIAGKSNNDAFAPEDSSDDLAVRFLDALLTALIEFPPKYAFLPSKVRCHFAGKCI